MNVLTNRNAASCIVEVRNNGPNKLLITIVEQLFKSKQHIKNSPPIGCIILCKFFLVGKKSKQAAAIWNVLIIKLISAQFSRCSPMISADIISRSLRRLIYHPLGSLHIPALYCCEVVAVHLGHAFGCRAERSLLHRTDDPLAAFEPFKSDVEHSHRPFIRELDVRPENLVDPPLDRVLDSLPLGQSILARLDQRGECHNLPLLDLGLVRILVVALVDDCLDLCPSIVRHTL